MGLAKRGRHMGLQRKAGLGIMIIGHELRLGLIMSTNSRAVRHLTAQLPLPPKHLHAKHVQHHKDSKWQTGPSQILLSNYLRTTERGQN